MKAFKAPLVQVLHFDGMDIITSSTCGCVDCSVCPPGKNDCHCYDFSNSYDSTNEGGRGLKGQMFGD